MTTCYIRDFIGHIEGIDTTQVVIGKGVKTKGSQESILPISLCIGVRLHDINRGENITRAAARLILVGPSGTQRVGSLTAKKTAVQLSCQGGEVHFLIITSRLIIQRIIRLATSTIAIDRVFHTIDIEFGVRTSNGAHRAGRLVGTMGMGMAETQVKLIVRIDKPVQTCQEFIVGSAQ